MRSGGTGSCPDGTNDRTSHITAGQQHHHLCEPSGIPQIRQLIAERSPVVSAVSYIDVLGFDRLTDPERQVLAQFFSATRILPIDQPVIDGAVRLRQQRRMSLGDSIVAATALVHGMTLATHNVRDFRCVPDLELVDPLTDAGSG